MKKYLIEREIPGVGAFTPEQLAEAAKVSNAALAQLGPKVQWLESQVTADKTFCVYLAEDESLIHEHSRLSGFPANKVTQIGGVISPATAG